MSTDHGVTLQNVVHWPERQIDTASNHWPERQIHADIILQVRRLELPLPEVNLALPCWSKGAYTAGKGVEDLPHMWS